jgi:hypothetical protein
MGGNLRGLGFLEFSTSNVVFGRCSGGRRTRFARKAYDKLGLYGKTMGVALPPRVWGGRPECDAGGDAVVTRHRAKMGRRRSRTAFREFGPSAR